MLTQLLLGQFASSVPSFVVLGCAAALVYLVGRSRWTSGDKASDE